VSEKSEVVDADEMTTLPSAASCNAAKKQRQISYCNEQTSAQKAKAA
jgi:hypothetical protein